MFPDLVLGIGNVDRRIADRAAPALHDVAQRYTIVTSAGGLSGTFSGIVDNLPDVDLQDNYFSNSVLLGLQQGGPESDKQNGPAAVLSAGNASLGFVETLGRRADFQEGGPSSAGVTVPLGYVDEDEKSLALQAIHNADLLAPAIRSDRLAVWLSGFGESTSADASSRGFGYQSNAIGAAGGIEARIYGAGTTILGIGVGYSHSDIDVTNGGADVDTGHVGIYASYDYSNFALNGALAYSWFDYGLSRNIAVGAGSVTANGGARGDGVSGYAEGFYDMASYAGLTDVKLGPVVRFRGVNASRGGYTETGAGILNLTVSDDSVSQYYGAIGGRVAGRIILGGATLTPQLDLLYERALDNGSNTSIAAIPVANAIFATPVSNGGRDRFLVGVGTGVDFNNSFSAHVRYDGSFAGSQTSNRGSLGISYKF